MSETTAGAGMVVPPPDATLDTPAGVVGAAPAGYASAAPVVGGKCSISDYAHHFIAAIVAIGYVVIIAIGTKPPDVLTGGFVTVIAAYLGGTVTAVGIRRANNGNSN